MPIITFVYMTFSSGMSEILEIILFNSPVSINKQNNDN